MKKAFFQVKIDDPEIQKLCAVITPTGVFLNLRMPQGHQCAASVYQRAVDRVYQVFSDFIDPYIDDSTIHSKTVEDRERQSVVTEFRNMVKIMNLGDASNAKRAFEKKINSSELSELDYLHMRHLVHIAAFLNESRRCNISLEVEKLKLFQTSIDLLGHRVTKDGLSIPVERIQGFLRTG